VIEGHANCSCPLCCPAKWTINAAAVQQQQYVHSQTGMIRYGDHGSPADDQAARIELRLARIEAILAAHLTPKPGAE